MLIFNPPVLVTSALLEMPFKALKQVTDHHYPCTLSKMVVNIQQGLSWKTQNMLY